MEEKELEFLGLLLEEGRLYELKEELMDRPYADIAEFIMQYDDDEKTTVKLFRILPKDISADVFSYLDVESQQTVV